jgi:hypothetical protein
VKLSLQDGQNGRKRLTLGIAILHKSIMDLEHARVALESAKQAIKTAVAGVISLTNLFHLPQGYWASITR